MILEEALARGALDPAHIALTALAPQRLWRVYARRFGPLGFNATNLGSARFSPLEHGGAVVPTLYAGTTPEVALMEVVLRGVPAHSAGALVHLDEADEPRRMALFAPSAHLTLVDLSTLGLRSLGLSRPDVIDCDIDGYPLTRHLARWLYANAQTAQGIIWTSRQDDRAQAIVLFETRLGGVKLDLQQEGQLITRGPYHESLLGLCKQLGVVLRIDRAPSSAGSH